MKNTFYFLLSFTVISILTPSLAQEKEEPFMVSPLIGDTLSLEERDYYNLLPTFDGFQFAIFYLNADSLLDVRVLYKTSNGIRDTLISKYKSLANMRIYLFKADIEMARKVVVYLENKTNISGGLVGSCIGLLTGLIYGSITSTPDITIQPFSEDNIKGLNQYSVYPDGEPDELRKIK